MHPMSQTIILKNETLKLEVALFIFGVSRISTRQIIEMLCDSGIIAVYQKQAVPLHPFLDINYSIIKCSKYFMFTLYGYRWENIVSFKFMFSYGGLNMEIKFPTFFH